MSIKRKTDLKAAIATLDLFAQKQIPKEDLVVKDGTLIITKKSSLRKFFSLLRTFFSKNAREKHLQRKRDVQTTLSSAISIIRKNHLLITKLHSGDEEEKQLASKTIDIIKKYNASLTEKANGERYGVIELPSLTSSKVLQESFSSAPVLNQEADLIRTKATTLLRQHGLLATGQVLHNANIQAKVHPHSQTSTVCLTLQVLPGTVIQVEGNFKRIGEALSAPIANSFALSVQADQHCFPYPSQHNGWALKSELIPSYIHCIDQLSTFKKIYQKRKELVPKLMPQGDLVQHAKKIHNLKQDTFVKNQTLLLNKQKELVLAIFRASDFKETYRDIVDGFFESVKKSNEPLQLLEDTYNKVGRSCISIPHEKLQEAWLEKSDRLHDATVAHQHVLGIFKQASDEQIESLSPFAQALSKAIAEPCHQILLQHWSETLECTPPMLNDFAQKLQLLAFWQLEEYQIELEHPAKEYLESMLAQLEREIDCLNAATFVQIKHNDVVYELEEYFNTRYLALPVNLMS